MRRLLLLLLVACSRPVYLGAEMPGACATRDIDGCLGWMVERDLVAAELGVYDDAELRGYVQQVTDRLARGSLLARPPRVWIGDRDGTYATVGGRIVVARPTLEKLATEAELAGVIAHEMAHLEGGHTVASLYGPAQDARWLVSRRDSEAIADERAVVLLERAGYAPVAMSRALRSVLIVEDEEHPAKDERIARVDKLALGRAGFEGRDELLAGIEGMVVGRDTRLGVRVGDAWVVAALGLRIVIDDADVVRSDDDLFVARQQRGTVTAYVIGTPWARELIATLDDRATARTDLGDAVTGTIPRAVADDDTPLGKLQQAIRGTLPQPAAGTRVAILARPRASLVIELGDARLSDVDLRVATAEEIATAEPPRLALVPSPRTGAIGELGTCGPRLLDDPARHVRAGERIKCAGRLLTVIED